MRRRRCMRTARVPGGVADVGACGRRGAVGAGIERLDAGKHGVDVGPLGDAVLRPALQEPGVLRPPPRASGCAPDHGCSSETGFASEASGGEGRRGAVTPRVAVLDRADSAAGGRGGGPWEWS